MLSPIPAAVRARGHRVSDQRLESIGPAAPGTTVGGERDARTRCRDGGWCVPLVRATSDYVESRIGRRLCRTSAKRRQRPSLSCCQEGGQQPNWVIRPEGGCCHVFDRRRQASVSRARPFFACGPCASA